MEELVPEKVDIALASEIGTACHMMLEEALKKGLEPAQLFWRFSNTTVQVVSGDDGAHAALSPSAAERWSVCPGSVVLAGKVARPTKTVTNVPVTAEMVEWVHVVLSWVLGYLRDNPGCVLYSEERARAGVPFGVPDDMWGTADVVIVNRAKLELVVFDAKFGYVEVQVQRNPQLLLYTIGLANDFGWAFKNHRLVIGQPRSEVPIKQEELSHPQLQDAFLRLHAKVREAHDQLHGNAPLKLVPTEEGCKWCPAAGICPELQKRTLELARREFMDPELLTRDQLVTLLKAAPLVRSALNAAEAHAARLLSLGQKVPGFKLVRGTKRRVWADTIQAAETLEHLGVRREDIWVAEMQFTPAQAEKKVGKHFADLLQPYIETPLGEPCLATEDDPRPQLPPEFEPC